MNRRSILIHIHKDLASGNLKIPILPEISMRIKKEAQDPNTNIETLSKIVKADAAFSGYLLQIANSAIYRGAIHIEKVSTAISRLGLKNTRNIAMTYAIRALFAFSKKNMQIYLKKVWQQCTYTGAVASLLAENIKNSELEPDEAILGGLLQDIGCLPLIEKASHFPEIIDDPAAIHFLFKRYAASIGAAIVSQWGLPEKFIQVARHRDDWQYRSNSKAGLVELVLIAKRHTYLAYPIKEKLPRVNQIACFNDLNIQSDLTPEESLSIIANAKQRIDETRRALNA